MKPSELSEDELAADVGQDAETLVVSSTAPKKRHGLLSLKLLGLAAGMFCFGYLMVPMYDIICEVTGLNGKTGRISIAESEQRLAEAGDAVGREITVEFVGIVSAGANWEFTPNQRSMKVFPGRQYETSYFARNLSSSTMIGQASPSVSPSSAAKYFNKTECFCFTRQVFEGNGGRDMPVTFVIDPKIPPNVDRVTLSYTFFRSNDQEQQPGDFMPENSGTGDSEIQWNKLGPSSSLVPATIPWRDDDLNRLPVQHVYVQRKVG